VQDEGGAANAVRTTTLRWGKYNVTLSDEDVLAAARAAIQAGLPEEARWYKRWAVDIDGEWVGVKWLLGYVTNIPTSEFQSRYAQDVLGNRLGLTIVDVETSPRTAPSGNVMPTSKDDLDRWLKVVSAQVTEIRAFLSGRAEHRPSDEKLCDWVQFCYTFGLYVEGRDLFALVNEADVNTWYLERTRKLARICSLKAGSNG
jgi:hypothetical protein